MDTLENRFAGIERRVRSGEIWGRGRPAREGREQVGGMRKRMIAIPGIVAKLLRGGRVSSLAVAVGGCFSVF